MLEVDNPTMLPPWPVLVRREGRAVAAYRTEAEARRHCHALEDARISWDRCTGIAQPKANRAWLIDRAIRARQDAEVERLIGVCLARHAGG